jgi:hypothetical protein
MRSLSSGGKNAKIKFPGGRNDEVEAGVGPDETFVE